MKAFLHLPALTMLLTSAAWAQSPTPTPGSHQYVLKLANLLLEKGEPATACYWLNTLSAEPASEGQRQYLLAHCLRDQGRVDEAVTAMEQSAQLLPNAAKPRLELGELYARQGRTQDAQALMLQAAQRTTDSQTNDELRALTERLSGNDPAALARARSNAKPWQIEAFAGVVYDTNINGGPSSSLVPAVVGNISGNIQIDPESRPIEAWGASESVSGLYRQTLSSDLSVLYQAAVNRTDYFSEPLYRNDSLSFAPTLIYQGQGYSTSLQPSVRYTRQGDDMQQADLGLTGRYTYVLNSRWNLTTALAYLDKDVRPDAQRDAHIYSATVGANVLALANLKLGADYQVSREQARSDIYSQRRHGPSMYALWQAMEDWQLIANYSYQRSNFDEPMALFTKERSDRQHSAGLTSLWDISRYTGYDMAVRVQYMYTDNPSNVGLYDFDRELASAGVQLRF